MTTHESIAAVRGKMIRPGNEGGIVTCPWHGCTFDICTGKSADKNNFKLHPAPRVEVDDASGEVVVTTA